MQFQLPLSPDPLPVPIDHRQRILLLGSCFTEHIGEALSEWKFPLLQNPHGILFGPDAIARALNDYQTARVYTQSDLFFLNECWHSWQHHSRFSAMQPENTLARVNESIQETHTFLRSANWLILTLGSAFTYRLTDRASGGGLQPGDAVANCHRAAANWFQKEMLSVEQITGDLSNSIQQLRTSNPALRVMLTISPVRHIRDGVVENNRSKARLIQAVQLLEEQLPDCYYFPAYEYVIDVLRDHRYYDIDLVHPNYAATQFVLEQFSQYAFKETTRSLIEEIQALVTARKHRVQYPESQAHHQFLKTHHQKTMQLQARYPYLNLSEELSYFSGQ
ncbi:MAG: GSCFA domain-containing protein [Bacteroidetes bacterium]|nr:GSCFA domain-containing protein [Bacteroidota bacterium]